MKELVLFAFNCVSDCGGADILRILKFVFILIDLVLFIVPIGLIVMIMIDFSKNVIAGKEDEMKKNVNMVIKRLIYCVVLFLVPTIVEFAVKMVSGTGDNIWAKASYCIDYAKNEDISICEVDYETFEPKYDTTPECYVCSFVDGRPSVYVWDTEKPASNYGGCTSDFRVDNTRVSENVCKNLEKQCWQCKDGSGYVLSEIQPGGGTIYKPGNSFGYSSGVCGAGFDNNPVADCNCTSSGCSIE